MNEHIMNVPDGNKSEGASINMEGFSFASGGSGHLPPGNYQVMCSEAKWVNKKGRSGKNLKIIWKVVAPRKYAGTQLVGNHPAPAGQAGDQAAEAGVNFYQACIGTVADAAGSLDKFKQQGKMKIPPSWFEGKLGHIRAEDETDNNGNLRSTIARYLPKKDFEESAGPDVSDDFDADISAQAGDPGAASGTPDLGGNGAAAQNNPPAEPQGDAVSDLMDIPGL